MLASMEAPKAVRGPRVYVVNEPLRRNLQTGRLERTLDLTPALQYGELVSVLSNGKVATDTAAVVQEIHEVLREYGREDFLLAVGDPGAIAIASACVALKHGGEFNLLKWDRIQRRYSVMRIRL